VIVLAPSIRLPVENLPAARPVFARMIEASRAEEGCIAYSFAEDVLEPGLIRIFEIFRDAQALKLHGASAHMQEWRAAWPALGIGDLQMQRFEASPLIEG
jgi:quinol monooxygenase YgiN